MRVSSDSIDLPKTHPLPNLKNEWVHHHDFKTREEASLAIFDYIECFYNTQRIHQTLQYKTPVEVEKLYYAKLHN